MQRFHAVLWAAFFMAITGVAAAAEPTQPDWRSYAQALRTQRDEAQQGAGDARAELTVLQHHLADREAAWAEYAKPLWQTPAAASPAPPIPASPNNQGDKR